MDYSLSTEQRALRDAVRELVADHLPSERVRAVMADTGTDRDAWNLLSAGMGLGGLVLPERVGGAAGTFVEAGLVLRELGAAVAPVPFASTSVASALLADALDDAEGATEAARRVATEGAAAGVGFGASVHVRRAVNGRRLDGTVEHVVDAPAAHLLVVVTSSPSGDTPDAYLVDTAQPGVRVTPRMTLDQTRRQARVELSDTAAVPLTAGGEPLGHRADALFRTALASESVGAARCVLRRTVEYLKVREQFGRPIGSFQALQHRCADLAVLVEAAESAVVHAEWAAAHEGEELAILAPVAASSALDAFTRAAGESIQMHGGLGFTWEHDAHLYFKRAKSTELLLGGAGANRRCAAERARVFDDPEPRGHVATNQAGWEPPPSTTSSAPFT